MFVATLLSHSPIVYPRFHNIRSVLVKTSKCFFLQDVGQDDGHIVEGETRRGLRSSMIWKLVDEPSP
jgi:hypothetical protein